MDGPSIMDQFVGVSAIHVRRCLAGIASRARGRYRVTHCIDDAKGVQVSMAGHGKLGLFEPIVKWLKNAIKHRHHGSTPHPHAPAHTTPRWRGKPLDPHYNFETIPNHPQNPFGSRAVRRLSPQELENHRVFIDQHGTFRNAHDGALFDSRGSTTHRGRGQSDRAIFTMDPNGNSYAHKYQAGG